MMILGQELNRIPMAVFKLHYTKTTLELNFFDFYTEK